MLVEATDLGHVFEERPWIASFLLARIAGIEQRCKKSGVQIDLVAIAAKHLEDVERLRI